MRDVVRKPVPFVVSSSSKEEEGEEEEEYKMSSANSTGEVEESKLEEGSK